jgi:hypothetical protein
MWLVISLVVVQSVLVVLQLSFKARLGILRNSYGKVSAKKKEVDKIAAQTDAMSKKMSSLEEALARPFSWTEKLNVLNDSMVPGIWLRELAYDERVVEVPTKPTAVKVQTASGSKVADKAGTRKALSKLLTLVGYVYSPNEDQTAVIGKFIKNLKESKVFRGDFANISVEDIRGEKYDNQEVMSFKIICASKD